MRYSIDDPLLLLEPLKQLHEIIRSAVVGACEESGLEALSAIALEEEGDTIYAVDRVSEDLLIDYFERVVSPVVPIVLIAEGLPKGKVVLPRGSMRQEAVWRVIVDPIDGTRGLMYQKRSGWILTGVARNRGDETCLSAWSAGTGAEGQGALL